MWRETRLFRGVLRRRLRSGPVKGATTANFPGGGSRFCIDFPSILDVFGSRVVLLVVSGGTWARMPFFHRFWGGILEPMGGQWGTLGMPCGANVRIFPYSECFQEAFLSKARFCTVSSATTVHMELCRGGRHVRSAHAGACFVEVSLFLKNGSGTIPGGAWTFILAPFGGPLAHIWSPVAVPNTMSP